MEPFRNKLHKLLCPRNYNTNGERIKYTNDDYIVHTNRIAIRPNFIYIRIFGGIFGTFFNKFGISK